MNSKVLTAIIVILVAVGAFYGGMKYQQSRVTNNFAQGSFRQRMGQGQFQGQGRNQNFGAVRGSILSLDSNSITVKLQDGSSKIVVLSGGTVFMKATSATKNDLKTGDTVMVTGTNNSDGSVTAQNVQINPAAFRSPSQPAQQ